MNARAPTTAPEILVVAALQVELQDVFADAGIDVLYTGIGKVNAAYALASRLSVYRLQSLQPKLVVNFGTAGSPRLSTGSLVACDRFIQRDMDVSGLGFPIGVTPFEELPAQIAFAKTFTRLEHGICGSGDSFATGGVAAQCDVVDMEAYALAKVCRLEGVEFACAKFVTDGADHAAAEEWQKNLHKAAERFLALYREL